MAKINFTPDSVTKYIGLVISFFLLSSLLFNSFYYAHYNISITQYIDLTESLLLFIPNIIYGVLGSFVIVSCVTIFFLFMNYIDRKNEEQMSTKAFIIVLLSTTLLFGLSMWWTLTHRAKEIDLIEAISFVVAGYFQMTGAFCLTFIKSRKKGANSYLVFGIILLITAFLYSLITLYLNNTLEKEVAVKTNDYFLITNYDNTSIKTDSAVRLVGQTKNYIFLYNRILKTTTVIQRKDVKQVEFNSQ